MIDWNRPIELATVPPRPAEVTWVCPDGSGADVRADWYGDGDRDWQPTDNNGLAYEHLPRVRNVATAPDLAAELAEALRDLVKCNEEWNDSVQKIIGRIPNWTDGYLDAARAALAKYESQEKET